jgi:hypothetical protein
LQLFFRDQSSPAVVIDTGATTTRFGYAGYEHPVAIFPTSLGYVEDSIAKKGHTSLKQHAAAQIKPYYFDSPLDPKRSPNWDDLIQIWQHGYDNQLNLHAEERGVCFYSQSLYTCFYFCCVGIYLFVVVLNPLTLLNATPPHVSPGAFLERGADSLQNYYHHTSLFFFLFFSSFLPENFKLIRKRY